MAESSCDELFSRNAPFVDESTQARLSEIKVGLIGCGLASQIALALARIGVQHFQLWDFDAVELSNLNRQGFLADHIGMNKAAATAGLLKSISSSIVAEIMEGRFTNEHLQSELPRLDVVVNSIDFTDVLVYDVSDVAQAADAWCIQPLNLGFGGACVILGPTSPSLASLTLGHQSSAALFIQNLVQSCSGFEPSAILMQTGSALLTKGDRTGWFPQNVVATLITTALVTWSVVQIATGTGEQIQAPRILHFEPKM